MLRQSWLRRAHVIPIVVGLKEETLHCYKNQLVLTNITLLLENNLLGTV